MHPPRDSLHVLGQRLHLPLHVWIRGVGLLLCYNVIDVWWVVVVVPCQPQCIITQKQNGTDTTVLSHVTLTLVCCAGVSYSAQLHKVTRTGYVALHPPDRVGGRDELAIVLVHQHLGCVWKCAGEGGGRNGSIRL